MPRLSKISLRGRSVARLVLALLLLSSLVALPTLSTAQLQPSGSTGLGEKRMRAEFVPGEILVRYRDVAEAERDETEPALQLKTPRGSLPMRVERFEGSDLVKGLRVVRVPAEETLTAIAALRARPGVLYAEPNYVRRKFLAANDTRFKELWGLKNTGQGGTSGGNPGTVGADIDAEPAWNITTGSRNVVVGVVDEGIDINHPDLKANVWKNPGEIAGNGVDDDANGFVDDTNGWDFFHNDKTVFDGTGAYPTDETDAHGTHVAGTIGAVGNNGAGVTGVNWQVSLMPLKVLGKDDEFGAQSSVLVTVRAYNYAKMMKDKWASSGGAKGANVRVLNNSYGGYGRSQAELDAIRALAASNILFVAAAGNESNWNDQVSVYPAGYVAPNLISVGATNNSDQVAFFSNFGARTVSMAAPGEWILSTTPNGTYDFYSGTSMSSPHVSGAAALVCAANPNITVRRLRAALMYSGDVLGNPDTDPYYHMAFASGRRLNALKSLQNVAENDTTPPAAITDFQVGSLLKWTAPGDNGNTGRVAVYEIRFSDTQPTTNEQFELAMPLLAPFPGVAGSAEEVTLDLPYRHPSGFVSIRAVDNVGNAGPITSVPVSNPLDYSDPYTVTTEAAQPLSTGGTPLNLKGDDVYAEGVSLPWGFQYYEGYIWNVGVSSNGVLYAPFIPNTVQGNLADNFSSADGLNSYKMIAGLWDDLLTDRRAADDVYVVKPDADRIIFRWQAVTYPTQLSPTTTRGENPVSFEIELNRNGVIKFRYGAGNQKLWPAVGISGGKPDAYPVLSHTSEFDYKSLANAQT
ncbi:MAG TPA: S8 family serine peptidase, partial [Pyrinomonadaceae bacterium]|nr:S8 family serine peptidase [Pyrinomonadaceae bacterium]